MDSIYLRLTREFNKGRLRCILSSGQAVVLHRLAIMSKDGDWIVREDAETLSHILHVLRTHDARYRLGAPLDVRWLRHGWSAHLEFHDANLRVRTDFVSRPPRLSPDDLESLWHEQETLWKNEKVPVIDMRRLIELKKTNRERDYAVIGDLARRLSNVEEQFLFSRSARDLIELAKTHPELCAKLQVRRPVLQNIEAGKEALETALDSERRALIRANESRLESYMSAASNWHSCWPDLDRRLKELPLMQAHALICEEAEKQLPFQVSSGL